MSDDNEISLDQIPFGALAGFADNPEPRCPCLLLLDTSGSMHGKPISELNEGIRIFKDELSADEMAAKRVEIGIVTFGPVNVSADFQAPDGFQPPNLVASGDTPMGEAIERGLALLDQRKQIYRTNGVSYYRPWIFLITDGGPTDHWQTASQKIKAGEAANHFSFFSVGVEGARMDILSQMATRQPLKLKELRFRDLFVWLSNSLGSVSKSAVTDKVELQNPRDSPGLGKRMICGGWKYAAASVIGTSHQTAEGGLCQDSHVCGFVESCSTFLAVVSDGAGSASHSLVGSRITCEYVFERVSAEGTDFVLSKQFADDVLAGLHTQIREEAQRTGLRVRQFACTLLVTLVRPERAVFWQIGDGAICFRSREQESFHVVFWPDKGEYANTTFFVTDENAAERLEFDWTEEGILELAVFSDGIERLALNFSSGEAHGAFFDGLLPYLRTREPGYIDEIAKQLAGFLASERINKRTDDDKTLILASRLV